MGWWPPCLMLEKRSGGVDHMARVLSDGLVVDSRMRAEEQGTVGVADQVLCQGKRHQRLSVDGDGGDERIVVLDVNPGTPEKGGDSQGPRAATIANARLGGHPPHDAAWG